MTMTNAEWCIKNNIQFKKLGTAPFLNPMYDSQYVSIGYYDITGNYNECYNGKRLGKSIADNILSWLDMKHEETEIKQNSVKHAHWVDMRLDDVHVCSHCDNVVVFSNGNDLMYCPYCGARMDEKDDE